jgi:hypothetical protein
MHLDAQLSAPAAPAPFFQSVTNTQGTRLHPRLGSVYNPQTWLGHCVQQISQCQVASTQIQQSLSGAAASLILFCAILHVQDGRYGEKQQITVGVAAMDKKASSLLTAASWLLYNEYLVL